MTKVLPKLTNPPAAMQIRPGGLRQQLEQTGRLPPVTAQITPIDTNRDPFTIPKFLNYKFSSSIMIPVSAFSLTFVAPDDDRAIPDIIEEGDIVTLFANNVAICTGIIDTLSIETDADFGERITIDGRDLNAQLEDHNMVDIDSSIIGTGNLTVNQLINMLIKNTRIPGAIFQNQTTVNAVLFGSDPSESKLTALQRFLEPLNMVSWSDPLGRIIIGKPLMGSSNPQAGRFYCDKKNRSSNVSDMKLVRSSATIPNVFVPIWSGTEIAQDKGISPALYNAAQGPARLYKLGHHLPKAIVASLPNASTPQGAADVNLLQAGGSNFLQALAKREAARQNHKERIVQVHVPSHYNESAAPYRIDTVYQIQFPRAKIDDLMYCFQADYSMEESTGQRTDLYFCNKGTIVADVPTV